MAGGKAVGEVVVKGGITMVAGAGGGYVGSEIGGRVAEYFGASETVTDIARIIGGLVTTLT